MYFAGLDAHLRYVTVAVLDRLGGVALETTVSTKEPERLLGALAPYRPLEVVVETCPFWPWLYDLLVPAGIGFHFIESALGDAWNAAGRTDTFALVVVRSDEINAASMGSGRFLVWEGVASLPPWAARGVMAHEVAHDMLNHARKATELQDVADFVGRVVGLLGHADDPDVGRTVQRWARNATLPHYSRSQEYQADSLGAVLLTSMGYDGPQGMAGTLRVLLGRYGNVEGGFFDYHPAVRDRIAALSPAAPRPR